MITRPVETDYPFFERIKAIWRTTQPPHEVVVDAMAAAGLQVRGPPTCYYEALSSPYLVPI